MALLPIPVLNYKIIHPILTTHMPTFYQFGSAPKVLFSENDLPGPMLFVHGPETVYSLISRYLRVHKIPFCADSLSPTFLPQFWQSSKFLILRNKNGLQLEAE